MATKGKKHLTEPEFKKIKALTQVDNLPTQTIADLVNRSFVTVRRIKSHNTFADYQEFMRLNGPRYQKRANSVTDPGTAEEVAEKTLANGSGMKMQKTLEYRTVEALERIAAAQELLVEAWNNAPKNKGLFNR